MVEECGPSDAQTLPSRQTGPSHQAPLHRVLQFGQRTQAVRLPEQELDGFCCLSNTGRVLTRRVPHSLTTGLRANLGAACRTEIRGELVKTLTLTPVGLKVSVSVLVRSFLEH